MWNINDTAILFEVLYVFHSLQVHIITTVYLKFYKTGICHQAMHALTTRSFSVYVVCFKRNMYFKQCHYHTSSRLFLVFKLVMELVLHPYISHVANSTFSCCEATFQDFVFLPSIYINPSYKLCYYRCYLCSRITSKVCCALCFSSIPSVYFNNVIAYLFITLNPDKHAFMLYSIEGKLNKTKPIF